jgi:hypothetical protein
VEPEDGAFADVGGAAQAQEEEAAARRRRRAAAEESAETQRRAVAAQDAQRQREARAAVADLSSALGKEAAPASGRVSSWRAGLLTLSQSLDVDDVGAFGSVIEAAGLRVPWGTPPATVVDLVLAEEVSLRPPPPPPPESEIARLLRLQDEKRSAEFAAFAERQEQAATAAAAAAAAAQASLAERYELLEQTAVAQQAELKALKGKLAAKERGGNEEDPWEFDDDPGPYVPHYRKEEPDDDGVVRWNPHQKPPRPPGCSVKPHLLPNLDESKLGKALKEHGAPEAWQEYVVDKSVLTYLWDSICFLKQWTYLFGGGSSPEAPAAAEALLNSLQEIYQILNVQLTIISIRTHAKAENKAGWKLDEVTRARLEVIETSRKSFQERYGVESSDVPIAIYNELARYEKQVRTAKFNAAAKKEGQTSANGSAGGGGGGGGKNVNVKAHARSGPTPSGSHLTRRSEAGAKKAGGGSSG